MMMASGSDGDVEKITHTKSIRFLSSVRFQLLAVIMKYVILYSPLNILILHGYYKTKYNNPEIGENDENSHITSCKYSLFFIIPDY